MIEHGFETPSFTSCEIRETRELLRFSLPDKLLVTLVSTRHNIGEREAAFLLDAARRVPPEAADELHQPGSRAALESIVAVYPKVYPSLVASALSTFGEDLGADTCRQIVHACHRRLVSVCPEGRDSADAAVRRRGLRIFCKLIESACRAERKRREELRPDPKRRAAIAAVTAKFDEIYPSLVAETTRKFSRRIGQEEAKDLLQEAYLKFRRDWPASGTTLPADPTEEDRSYGIALLKSAIHDVFIDRHIRQLRARYECQPKVNQEGNAKDFAANRDWREEHQPVYQAALLGNLAPKVWPRFCANCTGVIAGTRDALIEAAGLFCGCPADSGSLLNWCCSYLLNEADLGGLPGPWIKAYLQWRLALTAGAAEVRKFRLKAVLLEAIAAHLNA